MRLQTPEKIRTLQRKLYITFLACRAHYPGGPERVHSSVTPPFHAAFP